MVKAAVKDELPEHSNNPFDVHTSGRNPFPPFETALANDQPPEEEEETKGQDTGSTLDWSIDTLAELKPVAFSPLSQQKNAVNGSETPYGTSGFFEDEKQYEILRTPLSATPSSSDAVLTNRSTTNLTSPSPSTRCRRAAAAWYKSEERRRKTKRLLPSPTPKRLPRQWATALSRATPPRTAKEHKLGVAITPNSEGESPSMRSFEWSASPITMLCATPNALHVDPITPSPLVNASRKMAKQRSKLRLSFGLSPISAPNDEITNAIEECKYEKENEDQQAQREGCSQQEDSLSFRASSCLIPCDPLAKRSMAPLSSVPRRQQAFMEAMDAESHTEATQEAHQDSSQQRGNHK